MMVYEGSVELSKENKYDKKWNMDIKKWVWWHYWIRTMRVWWNASIRILSMSLMCILYLHTPWNIFLRKLWVWNVYSSMFIWRKVGWYETYVQFCHGNNYKTQWYTKHTWIMRGRGDGMIPKSNSPITINNFYIILKGRVAYILIHTSTYCNMRPTITSFIFMNTIIPMKRRTRYIQQSTMATWVIGRREDGLVPISTSTITTKSWYL